MSERIKVGILTQWYSPEPVLIPKTVSDAAAMRGNTVKVLTGFPNYPGGVLYPGYEGDGSREEFLDLANVLRIRSFLSHDENALRRIRSFLSFAWGSLRHAQFLMDRDVNYVYGTPMTAVAAAVYLRARRNIPFLVHVQDLWPESVLDSGMLRSPLVKRLLHKTISAGLSPVYRLAQHIIVISPGMKQALVGRGVDAKKITVLYNWHPAEENPESGYARTTKSSSRIRCVYAGNIGQMQDVETIIRAAAQVQDELDLEIMIYGSGVAEDAVRALAKELEVRNVTFMGRVSMEDMKAVYRQSDFQLVTLKDREVFRMTIPSKFQASLANATPVITTVAGDLATICRDEGLGLVAEPQSASSLADALRQAVSIGPEGRNEMAKRAYDFYWKKMAADRATSIIRSLLMAAVTGSAPNDIPSNTHEGKKHASK